MTNNPPSANGPRDIDIRLDDEFMELYARVRPYTMTSIERLYDLWHSVRYVVAAGIPGAIVECGVWKGGSMMLVAETLKALGRNDRHLMLFDTFRGLPMPDPEIDIDILGNAAADRYRDNWAAAGLDEVDRNMTSTGYADWSAYSGMVEETLPKTLLGPVAIARLDTDWYASTKVELEVLWPRLSHGGLLIIDDYGHWQGARKATDEFFADKPAKLTRVDYSCRVAQKL